MKISNCFIYIILLSLIYSCQTGKNSNSKNFQLELATSKKNIQLNDTLTVTIQNKKQLAIDSVSYTIKGTSIKNTSTTSNFQLILKDVKLGVQELQAIVFSGGEQDTINKNISIFSDTAPVIYGYKIINEYPHDVKAFTQGLEFYNNKLYESTGKNGASSLRITNFETGAIELKTDLESQYFGEGITVLNDKVYMLSWQAKTGFVYDALSLEKLDSFKYGQSKEGWGLCNDGARLYKSDGTENIWILDPATLIEQEKIQVCTNNRILKGINELEWVNGKIYANTWQQNREVAVIVNPSNGAVEALINFTGLKDKVSQHPDVNVLNGIAYRASSNSLFVTGKYWDKIFEVELIK
jgi:glutaminyl-peptide cyclotransferase